MDIMIVDDNTPFREFIVNMIKARFPCAEVRNACDGMEALALLKDEFAPKLVLTDIMMPRMNGTTLCHSLKAKYPYGIKVVGMSGDCRVTDPAFDRMIAKPFDVDTLYAIIEDALNDGENQKSGNDLRAPSYLSNL